MGEIKTTMLTKRQKQVLDFITGYQERKGYAPSLEEIQRHFKLASVSTAHFHVKKLQEKGFLRKEENQPRSISVLENEKMVYIPLLGRIAAGQPIEAIEDRETISVPESQLSKSGKHYALQVAGDSMIDEGIFDGDIVVIRKQSTAENGETVVALINNNEVTLKKIYREKNGFRLQPANLNLKPIFTKELTVQGKVLSVFRSFGELKEKIGRKKEFTDATIKYIEEANIQYRKSLGQYFTPRSVREALLSKLPNTIKHPEVLDPACGTGEFLITAKEHFDSPELYGWDIDKKLVSIVRKEIPNARLKHIDALLSQDYDKYDFVVGNPPYYEFTPSEEIKNKFESVINGRVNIFSLFIYQGLKCLKEGGYLAYVVPPSMNNGAYFLNLRKFIVENANIEYLHILSDPKIFRGALQSTMLLILKKGKNKGNYLIRKNGILIFSEDVLYLEKAYKNSITLHDIGYEVRTGRLVWNQNRHLLTNTPNEAIPLVWAHNLTPDGLKFPINSNKKPQYVKTANFDIGPAVVVNRIAGSVKTSRLKAAVIPPGMKFIAENHVNVIFPSSTQEQMAIGLGNNLRGFNLTLQEIAKQLSSEDKSRIVRSITGNTQISKTELERLFPFTLMCASSDAFRS